MQRSTVETIKEKLNIVDVVGQYIELKPAGKTLKGKCPFHNERTPSFFVSPDRGTYYCFGCGAKGDIFSFVEQFEGLDFMGALKLLAERAGVQLDLTYTRESKVEKERSYAIMEDAAKFFEKQFALHKEPQVYVESRGLTAETVASFRIGFIPAEWRLLTTYLLGRGYTETEIETYGLGKKTEKGMYDRFRGRVMFPISDSSGRVIAFTGRILVDDGESAKYLNSPETPLFTKANVLFGIDKAKGAIRKAGYSIFVEGQMDLIMAHQIGTRNTVAVSGTALSDSIGADVVNNLGIIQRLSPNVILAFDSDKAGRKATLRSADILLTLGMDVKVARIPDAKDPADLIRDNPEQWKLALKNSVHIVEFVVDGILKEHSDIRKATKLVREFALPFIAKIKSTMERSHFVRLIAERLHIPESAVWDDVKAYEKAQIRAKSDPQKARSTPESPPPKAPDPVLAKEHAILKKISGIRTVLTGVAGVVEKLDTQLRAVVGEEKYNVIHTEYLTQYKDSAFEIEVLYGNDPQALEKTFGELIQSLEESLLREEFAVLMEKITVAERTKDSESEVQKWLARCQEIGIRLRGIEEKRSRNN